MLITENKTSEHATNCYGCQPKEDLLPSRSVKKRSPLIFQLERPAVSQTPRILALLVPESEPISRVPLYDDNNIYHNKTDTFKSWSTPSSDTDILCC